MFKSIFATAVTLFYLLNTSFALADRIRMKNGDTFSGKIISFNHGLCIFDTDYGSPIRIPTADIQSIATEDRYNIFFVNGEQATGALIFGTNNQTLLESSTFGQIFINTSNIARLTKYFPPLQDRDSPSLTRKPTTDGTDKNHGAETEVQPPLDFLTGATVLLSPGEYEMGLGMAYKQNRLQYPLSQAGYFQKSSYSARQLEFRPTLRAGLYTNIEGYLSLPVTYSSIKDVSSNEHVRHADAWNMADIALGAQYQVVDESTNSPAISLTFDLSVPTGRKRYHNALNNWKDPLNNGSGHWTLAPGLAFVRSTDPAILFSGISYQYYVPSIIDGYHVQPGWVLKSYAGVGLALNEKLSLGTRLSYAYSSNLKADHKTIHGSDSDPLELALSTSYRVSDDWVISPGIALGLNDDAGPAVLSLDLKRRFN